MSASAQSKALAQELTQEDDRGFIVGLLEDALGGEGRIVRVDGFQGALSKTATIEQLTIADEEGVWLAFEKVQLRWTRSALLLGRIDIQQLSAASLDLIRPPIPAEGVLPSAEARGFSLPNLPVAISIDLLKIDQIRIGREILGETAEMQLEASAQLENGSGSIVLKALRTDGKEGRFVIDASYQADTQMASIDLDLTEPSGGIAARVLNLPERPDLRLSVSGAGSIDDLVTDVSLETAGVQRLNGQVTSRGSSEAGRDFSLDLSGDLTPFISSEYHQFFGKRSTLRALGKQNPVGALELSDLTLETRALALKGSVALDPEFAPVRLVLDGRIKPATEGRVVLPFADGLTSLESAQLSIAYDGAVSDLIDATFDIDNFTTTGVTVGSARLSVQGTLASVLSSENKVDASVGFRAAEMQFADVAQQQAIGDNLTGSLNIEYRPGGPVRIEDIVLTGEEYSLTGALFSKGIQNAFATNIDVALKADRLSRFSTLLGSNLRGQAELAITGVADFGGAFDLTLAGSTTDLGVGIPQVNNALAGVTKLNLSVVRDADGTRLPNLTLKNNQIDGQANATFKTDASDVEFDVTLANSARIDSRLEGPVTLVGRATQDVQGWNVDTKVDGPFGATSTLVGRATGKEPTLKFDVRLPDVRPLARQFRGPATLTGTAFKRSETWQLDTDLQGPYGISGALAGSVNGASPKLRYTLRIPNVASLGAQIDGLLALEGSAEKRGTAWRIDTDMSGLSGTRANLSGSILQGGSVDLNARGSAPLALANPFLAPRNIQGQAQFNIALRGRPNLSAVSGTVETTNARLSAPTLRNSLSDLDARIALSRGRAEINATAAVSSGGRIAVQGPIVLSSGLNADLAITLNSVQLVDPLLYRTSLDGRLTVRGPLRGGGVIAGQIDVGETNIKVPESRNTGFTIIPQIVHRNASRATKQTLRRAGLSVRPNQSGTDASGGAPFDLNIRVNAPSRIFVRGRGLDAELGGALRISGQTNRVISTGRFGLIRGRVDILTKRFVLDEGSIALQGTLDPFLRFVATTQTSSGTASIIIEGPASEPRVTFSATPEAPQDEILAQIFFGRDVSKLSAFQALQLASAVATLAGAGGEGVIAKLRRGFGLDDLDITTDDEGNTGLRLGKYLTENVYTDVTVGSDNTAGVSINIDLSKSLTARGQVKSNCDSSVGIFFEKDY